MTINQPPGQSSPNTSEDITPSTGTLFLILIGCLLTGCLLVFLFKPVLMQRAPQKTTVAPEHKPAPDHKQPAEIIPAVVSNRPQPVAPTSVVRRVIIGKNKADSKKNLKQIGLALYNYNATYAVLPPGGTQTKAGKPYHSWQTSILPFLGLDQAVIYNKINFDAPWNTPQNYELFHQEVPYYLNPAISVTQAPDGAALSHYVGNSLLLSKNGSIGLNKITDKKSQTIMALEIGNNFKVWGDPTSIDEPANLLGPDQINSFPDGNHALMSDGSVRFLSKDINPVILRVLSTPNGGEKIRGF